MKKFLAISALAIVASCGGADVVYVTDSVPPEESEATTTTVKKAQTTLPPETRPPASVPESSGTYSPELYDDFLYSNVREFWMLFSTEQLLQMGLLVCEEFDRGQTIDQVTASLVGIVEDTGAYSAMEGLAAVTAGSLTFLCPEHRWWLDTL